MASSSTALRHGLRNLAPHQLSSTDSFASELWRAPSLCPCAERPSREEGKMTKRQLITARASNTELRERTKVSGTRHSALSKHTANVLYLDLYDS